MWLVNLLAEKRIVCQISHSQKVGASTEREFVGCVNKVNENGR